MCLQEILCIPKLKKKCVNSKKFKNKKDTLTFLKLCCIKINEDFHIGPKRINVQLAYKELTFGYEVSYLVGQN